MTGKGTGPRALLLAAAAVLVGALAERDRRRV